MIKAVGQREAITVPPGAQVVAGKGKTLIPGLWDSHLHYFGDEAGPRVLSQGITTIRDPGNYPEEIIERKQRIDEGKLLGPRIIASLIIDGPGPYSVFLGPTITDEKGAIDIARKAKAQGFVGIKTYGSLDSALIAPLAQETARLGLRLHGHLPKGVRPLDAIRAGYDEINHGNFLLLQGLPDEVVSETQTLARHYGPMSATSPICERSTSLFLVDAY